MAQIHPTAVVEAGAVVADSAAIGPYCVVGPEATIGEGAVLRSHVVVGGRTRLGPNTQVYPFAAVGQQPQDLKYSGEPTELVVGANTVIREHATLNPGTKGGGSVTRVGDNCVIMIGSHVAHDCHIGNNVILVNNALLGGHVTIEDYAIVGGGSAIHQFVRIGAHAMIGGMSGVENDVIPYGSVIGNRAYLSGLNVVGLKRRGFPREDIHKLRNAYRLLFAEEGTMQERLADVATLFADCKLVMDIVAFIKADSSRALCQPRAGRGG
jgi:UDP-N-acetylglucosamine acyltransferase